MSFYGGTKQKLTTEVLNNMHLDSPLKCHQLKILGQMLSHVHYAMLNKKQTYGQTIIHDRQTDMLPEVSLVTKILSNNNTTTTSTYSYHFKEAYTFSNPLVKKTMTSCTNKT